jgi:choline dehydrogenase-like flavoprotein
MSMQRVSGTTQAAATGARFRQNEPVDFIVIGSGAAGGVIARELSAAGLRVVVLEQGPFRRSRDFTHDELGIQFNNELCGGIADHPVSWRKTAREEARFDPLEAPRFWCARGVGGSSVHFTANFWRFHEIDFIERSKLGAIAGTGFADWPITYAELEPYYSKVDWEIGVSGAPGPFDPPRSRPYPMPPLPVKSSGVLFEQGARKIGLHPQPAPMAILSRPHNGRAACQHCGYCIGYGCEFGAKSSTLVAMVPQALGTGRCEIRAESTVVEITTNPAGRVTGARYLDRQGGEQHQAAKAVVLCGNGAETPRLLLMSTSSRFPQGLANSSGHVGHYLMFNMGPVITGSFEHPLNEYKSVQVTRIVHDFYDTDPQRGFYGGGGLDGRHYPGPLFYALFNRPPRLPTWGAAWKKRIHEEFTRTMDINGHTTSLPLATNTITLDPKLKDKWGRPAIRVTYKDHPDDIKTSQFLMARGREILEAAGARRIYGGDVGDSEGSAHWLGTCRMGNDPRESVVNKYHRAHDVPNLFICDGSSFVTSGRGQPTMTIQALAFRAAELIAGMARRREI